MMILAFRVITILFILFYGAFLFKDVIKNGPKDESMLNKVLYGIMGFVLNILDTLGVGSNATQAAFFKLTKLSPDDELPGNGNVIFAISGTGNSGYNDRSLCFGRGCRSKDRV